MTRSDGLDQLLDDELSRVAAQIHGDDALTRTLVDGSVTRLRRHQRRRAAVAAATTTLAVVATGLVGWQLQSSSGNAGPAMHVPNSISVPTVAQTYHLRRSFSPLGAAAAWAHALPRGDDTTLPFVAGTQLFEGGRLVELGPRTEVLLVASLPGGWLARYSDQADSQGNHFHWQTGFLDINGHFRAFAFTHEPGFASPSGGFASSPDGSQVAYAGGIVDVATGMEVRPLPPGARYVSAWTQLGIAYLDTSGRQVLWAPGSLPRTIAWKFRSSVTATKRVRSCTRIAHLGDDGIISRLATLCGDPPVGISDSGFAMTNSGAVIDLSTGRELGHIPFTAPMDGISLAECCGVVWSSDGHLLVTVLWRGSLSWDAEYVLVSCTTDDDHLTCTRASDPMPNLPFPVRSLIEPWD